MNGAQATGRRLGNAVLAYLGVTLAVVTLSPFRFASAPVNALAWVLDPFDVVMNVVMFVPLGFVHRLSRPRASATWLGAALLGVGLSGLIEAVQVFAPGRFPSLVDVATNACGAVIGAGLGSLTLRRSDAAATVRAAAVELPLMGLVYVLVPLPWLVGIGGQLGERAWLLLPLTASAGWIIGSVFTSYERAPLVRVLVATGAWLLVGLFPTALTAPRMAWLPFIVGLGAAAARRIAPSRLTQETASGPARRFEASTLRIVLPLLVLYVIAGGVLPLAEPRGAWVVAWEVLPLQNTLGNDTIFRLLAHVTAFTVLGYAVAEYAGRTRDHLRMIIPPVAAWAAALSGLVEFARGWHPAHVASGMMFALTVSGAILGSFLYTLQLAHVRALVRRQP